MLRSGKRYYYKISAVSDKGEGALSNEATAVTWSWITASGGGSSGESCQNWLLRTGQLLGTEPLQAAGEQYLRTLDLPGGWVTTQNSCAYQMPGYWNWCGLSDIGMGCGYYRNNAVYNFVAWGSAVSRFYPNGYTSYDSFDTISNFGYTDSSGWGPYSYNWYVPEHVTQILKNQRGYLFTATTTGSGGTGVITGLGINCGSDCERYYDTDFGDVNFTATPNFDSLFVQWSGSGCNGSTNPQCTLNVGDGPTNLTADFKLKDKFKFTVVKSGNGLGAVDSAGGGPSTGINCGADCEEVYYSGTPIYVNFYPNSDSRVASVTKSPADGSGNCSSSGCYIFMDQDKQVNVVFEKLPVTRNGTKSGTGAGTVSGTGINCGLDCAEIYNSGVPVTLTASSTIGSAFAGWSGSCIGTDNCVLLMNSNKAVNAIFNQAAFQPEVGPGGIKEIRPQ